MNADDPFLLQGLRLQGGSLVSEQLKTSVPAIPALSNVAECALSKSICKQPHSTLPDRRSGVTLQQLRSAVPTSLESTALRLNGGGGWSLSRCLCPSGGVIVPRKWGPGRPIPRGHTHSREVRVPSHSAHLELWEPTRLHRARLCWE